MKTRHSLKRRWGNSEPVRGLLEEDYLQLPVIEPGFLEDLG
jgi:hypothetical protein